MLCLCVLGASEGGASLSCVRKLIVCGADIEGGSDVCENLSESGDDVDHSDKKGKTVVSAAASMGHVDILNIFPL